MGTRGGRRSTADTRCAATASNGTGGIMRTDSPMLAAEAKTTGNVADTAPNQIEGGGTTDTRTTMVPAEASNRDSGKVSMTNGKGAGTVKKVVGGGRGDSDTTLVSAHPPNRNSGKSLIIADRIAKTDPTGIVGGMGDRGKTLVPAEAPNREIEDRVSTRRAVKAGITNTGT